MIASIHLGQLFMQGPKDPTYQLYTALCNVLGPEGPAPVGHYYWEYAGVPGLRLLDNRNGGLALEIHTPEAELIVLANLPEGLSLCYVST